jgi:N,N'-diacetyllegionaminate synthase
MKLLKERSGHMSNAFIIAEAGSTWRDGVKPRLHLAKAMKCIRIAKACGADAVKFQWTSAPGLMAARRHVTNVGAYHFLAWPQKWLKLLAAECEEVGIEFMCTVFLVADVPTIAPFVKRFKIASLEAMDLELFDACEQQRKPIMMSCGAMSYEELEGVVSSIGSCATEIKLLHCVAAYPAPINQMNLGVFRSRHGSPFTALNGLSDHSGDLLTGALAVACGAEIVEVHLRLDETRPENPDYAHSHSPAGLKQYIAAIRKAELMLGDGIKKVEERERPMLAHRVTA